MGCKPDSRQLGTLKIYFADDSQNTLVKFAFYHPNLSRPKISLLLDHSGPSEAYSRFTDSHQIKSFALLLVRASIEKLIETRSPFPIILGAVNSPAEKLYSGLQEKRGCLNRLLWDLFEDPKAQADIFHSLISDNLYLVTLADVFIDSTEIAVIKDEKAVTAHSELVELERKILNTHFNADEKSPSLRRSQLSLVSSEVTDEMKHTLTAETPSKIIELFSSGLEEVLIKNRVDKLKKQLDGLTKNELAYHISQHTEIDLVNESRDWRISFEFELMNASFVPITKRTHQYWFEQPQAEINFKVEDTSGHPIKFSVVKSSEKYREIVLELPKVLNALERLKYRVSYQVKGIPKQDSFYYLSPRTVTKELSLTIKAFEGYSFTNYIVSVETESGHVKDTAPGLAVTKENGIETLRWSQTSPKPGELFRTFWSDSNFGKVIDVAERKRMITSSS